MPSSAKQEQPRSPSRRSSRSVGSASSDYLGARRLRGRARRGILRDPGGWEVRSRRLLCPSRCRDEPVVASAPLRRRRARRRAAARRLTRQRARCCASRPSRLPWPRLCGLRWLAQSWAQQSEMGKWVLGEHVGSPRMPSLRMMMMVRSPCIHAAREAVCTQIQYECLSDLLLQLTTVSQSTRLWERLAIAAFIRGSRSVLPRGFARRLSIVISW